MQKFVRIIASLSLIIIAVSCGQNTGSPDSELPVQLESGWVREAPPNATAMAGYAVINNSSAQELNLVSATSPSFNSIEFHRSIQKDGMFRMIRQETLALPAHGTLELKPGDFHLMLMSPKQALRDGDKVEITLNWSDGQQMEITLPVKKATGG